MFIKLKNPTLKWISVPLKTKVERFSSKKTCKNIDEIGSPEGKKECNLDEKNLTFQQKNDKIQMRNKNCIELTKDKVENPVIYNEKMNYLKLKCPDAPSECSKATITTKTSDKLDNLTSIIKSGSYVVKNILPKPPTKPVVFCPCLPPPKLPPGDCPCLADQGVITNHIIRPKSVSFPPKKKQLPCSETQITFCPPRFIVHLTPKADT